MSPTPFSVVPLRSSLAALLLGRDITVLAPDRNGDDVIDAADIVLGRGPNE
jgi:hypothetical protein